MNPPRVTLHLRRPCEFGDRVVFLPPVRFSLNWKSHPLVKELQDEIARAPER